MGLAYSTIRRLTGAPSSGREAGQAAAPDRAQRHARDPSATAEASITEERREWDRRAAEERARREAEFQAGSPVRDAERWARLIGWALDFNTTIAELHEKYTSLTIAEEASRRRRLNLPPRNDAERECFREQAELDADVLDEILDARQREQDALSSGDCQPSPELEAEAEFEAGA